MFFGTGFFPSVGHVQVIYAFVAFSSFVSAMTNATNELRAFTLKSARQEAQIRKFLGDKKLARNQDEPCQHNMIKDVDMFIAALPAENDTVRLWNECLWTSNISEPCTCTVTFICQICYVWLFSVEFRFISGSFVRWRPSHVVCGRP